MSLINLLFPNNLKFPDTEYNKNIELVQNIGEPTLIIDGLVESGYLLTNIWKLGIENLIPKNFKPKSILLLGLGGGSNAKLVSKKFPSSQITAVEIDSQVVQIANEYYGLNKIKNLQVVNSDATKYISQNKKHFDLILVDCFVGKFIPQKVQKISFLKKLYNHSTYTLINRIWWNEHHLETVFFLKKIRKHFFFTKVHTQTNIVVSLI